MVMTTKQNIFYCLDTSICVSSVKGRKKEGNILFNDAPNTFYLWSTQ